jgi:hypothetical protein
VASTVHDEGLPTIKVVTEDTSDSAVEAQPDATYQDWSSAIDTLVWLFIVYLTTPSKGSRLHSE